MFEEGRNFRLLSILALPYAMSVALAWALGYWRTFAINPFEYAGPAEIASLSAYALMASLSALIISGFLTKMLIQGPGERALDALIKKRVDQKIGTLPELPEAGDCGPEELANYQDQIDQFGESLRRFELRQFFKRLLVAFSVVLAALLAYLQQSHVWLGVFAFSPVIAFFVADPIPEKVKDALSRSAAAEIVLCIMLSLPMVSFLYGAQKAFQIKDGQGTMLLFEGKNGDQLGALYVGRMGDHIFTFNVCSEYVEVKKDNELPGGFKLAPNAKTQCSEAQQGAAADR